nr:keratin, type I cytoskeletal 10-like [Rhipicephalus microplus]
MGNGFGGAGLNEAGMTSGPFGNTGFGGFGGGENSVEEGTGRSPSGPRVGSGGGFSGEAGQPPRTSFGGHGGSGFGDGHFGGVGFGGGHFSGGNFGGDFSRTTSSGGHRWNNMPSRGPPSLGMPGGGAGRVSSGESPEEEGALHLDP